MGVIQRPHWHLMRNQSFWVLGSVRSQDRNLKELTEGHTRSGACGLTNWVAIVGYHTKVFNANFSLRKWQETMWVMAACNILNMSLGERDAQNSWNVIGLAFELGLDDSFQLGSHLHKN